MMPYVDKTNLIMYLIYAGINLILLLALMYVLYTLEHWDDWRYK